MALALEPLTVPSLKEACIRSLEGLILSGALKIGARLPPERTLAVQLGVSRPVVHQAIVELAAKGLVDIAPRRGVFVNDFRTRGSCALLTTLLTYREGELAPDLRNSLIDMRLLVEAETARLAALHCTPEHLAELKSLLIEEGACNQDDVETRIALDFAFHLQVALASGNLMYPLMLNSVKGVYTNLTSKFFAHHRGSIILEDVLAFHRALVAAIEARDSETARFVMVEMLNHGSGHLPKYRW